MSDELGFSRDNKVGFSRDTYVGFRRDGKPKPNEPAVFGPSVREPQKTLEINRVPDALAVATTGGAFYGQYVDDAGDTYLQGGTITGGNGGEEVVDDYKVLDDTTGVGTLEGDKLYLSCNVTATVEDSIMLPGLTLNSATLTRTLPSEHEFTVAAPTGVVFIEVGRWTASSFLPATSGGLSLVSGCIGTYQIT